jgi:hypothetical protein
MKIPKQKTVYVLRIHLDESKEWGKPIYYNYRVKRNEAASLNRIIGGLRTWSYQERMDASKAMEVCEDV